MNSNWDVSLTDINILLNICYLAAWLAGVTCVLHLTYKFISEYTYLTVNCWFCNQNIKIPFKQRNEWFCTQCDQFNGFNKDGDYSRPIPEQYSEHLNVRNSTRAICKKNGFPNLNGLCRTCNANQELKIRQIASYVPFREEDYDQEIELFKEKLEKSYKLCTICERTVQSTLKLKVSLYASTVPKRRENYLREVSRLHQSRFEKWKYLTVLLMTTTLLVSLGVYTQLFDSLFEYGSSGILGEVGDYLYHTALNTNYSILLNMTAVVLITLFMRSIRGKAALLSPLVIGILAFSTDDEVSLILKLTSIVLIVIYFCYKRWKRNKNYSESFRKLSSKVDEFDSDVENSSNVKEDISFTRNVSNPNSHLCGNFSSLSLGRMQMDCHTSSYLFKSSKLLVQPPKLILDDLNKSGDSARSSPTVSSGYDSVTSFFRRSCDSISEFDSVSQVEHKYNGLGREPTNWISPYAHRPNHVTSNERYYGVSSALSSSFSPNRSSTKFDPLEPQVSAFFSTLQIFLCSLAFFILGVSFQMLVRQFIL